VRVRWLTRALANLEAEADYIARDNSKAAASIVQAVHEAVNRLQQFPALGRPGRVVGTRELVISGTPYIVPYRVRNDEIQILRVFHGARKWPSKL
jgi:toxin ParE1/3/4